MASTTLRAFAKINLRLRIKDARPDGFHELETIFQAIDLHDRITFEARRGPFEIRCAAASARRVPGVPIDRTNLVWKAAQQLWSAAGRGGEAHGAIVTLDKHIPIQAGLGGGSSDAAAALIGLRSLWKLQVDPEELHAIAAELGSDVPYFLVGGTALGLGRGDEVYPLDDLPRLWIVLALPSFGIATKDAYAWWDAGHRGLTPAIVAGGGPQSGARPAFPAWLSTVSLVNDFEGPVVERHPAIGAIKGELQAAGAVIAAMSGSGSTVFGVFTSGAAAGTAARRLARSSPPRTDVRVARFQPRKKR